MAFSIYGGRALVRELLLKVCIYVGTNERRNELASKFWMSSIKISINFINVSGVEPCCGRTVFRSEPPLGSN